MFKHLLVPTDGTTLSEDAVRYAVRLAKAVGARITFFHAIPKWHASDGVLELLEVTRGDFAKAARAYAAEHLHFVEKVARASGVECAAVRTTSDDPAGEIVKAAAANMCDLILMGSHGRHGIEALLIGSVTQKVLVRSRIPVLVYR